MLKKQLTIYRNFSSLYYEFDPNEQVSIPVPSQISLDKIYSNRSFSIQNQTLMINHQIQSKETSSLAIHETENEEVHDPIEIILRFESISWRTSYTLFKNTKLLFCNLLIQNPDQIIIPVNDIKVVFRSTDYEYDAKDKLDVPTLHTDKMVEYNLDVPNDFELKNFHHQILLWKHKIDLTEVYEVDLMDENLKYAYSHLVFKAPELILLGHLEIFDRKDNHTIHVGSLDMKLYKKDERVKIYFPKNNYLPIKSNTAKSNHSFFMNKNHFRLESKLKNKLHTKAFVRYYFYQPHPIKNLTVEPTLHEKHFYAWDRTFEPKEQNQFHLEFDLEN